MDKKLKVLFAAFEAQPFLQTGGLGDVAGALPAALNSKGVSCRLIMPKFASIPQQFKDKMKHVADFYMPLGWRSQYVGIDTLRKGGVTCYFIDNEYYFGREKPYGYYDDGERIAFFSKAVLEALNYLPTFKPDIIHCNDWHTALTPVFLRHQYADSPVHAGIKTIFTIHNLKFQGMYSDYVVGDVLGMSYEQALHSGMIMGQAANYMRGALCVADRLTTVSPTYAGEICTEFYGEHVEDVLRSRSSVLSGILNGIDYKRYAPMSDKNLAVNYDAASIEKKAEGKLALQRELGLPERADVPMCVIVSRLTEQKGLDLVLGILDELLEEDMQLVVLGVGDEKYEAAFARAAVLHPDKAATVLRFDEPFSHRLYAAADMALVPSLFEPCGLTQMIAMNYGTLPVVRETGGLRDSVRAYNKYTDEGTGFSFANYNAHELLFTLKDAFDLYNNDRAAWDRMVQRAMAEDFSWNVAADKYVQLYESMI